MKIKCRYLKCKSWMKEVGVVLNGDTFETVFICTNPDCDNSIVLYTDMMI